MRGHANSKYSGRGSSSYRGGSSGGYYNDSYYSSPSRGGYHNNRGRGRGGHVSHPGRYYNNYGYEPTGYSSSSNGIESSPPKQERTSVTPGSREGEYSSAHSDHHFQNNDDSSWNYFSSSQSYQQGRGGFYLGFRQGRGRGRGRGSFKGYERGVSAGNHHPSPYDEVNRSHNQYSYHYDDSSKPAEVQPLLSQDPSVVERLPTTSSNIQSSENKTEVEKIPVEKEIDNRQQEMKKEAEFKEKHWINRIKVTGDVKSSIVSLFEELDNTNSKLLELGSRCMQLEIDVLKYNRILRTEEERVSLTEESLEAMEFDFQP